METVNISCFNYSITGDWTPGKTTDDVLLFLIGWSSSRSRHRNFINTIVKDTGMSVLVIDYSGHGESPFELEGTKPAQHLLEATASYDWIVDHHPSAKVSVLGSSYGGYLASHLVAYRSVEKLVLRAPAIYEPSRFYDTRSQSSEGPDYRQRIHAYRSDSETLRSHPLFQNGQDFGRNALVIVHEHDESVPVETTDFYTKAFSADQYIAKGLGHSINQNNMSEQQLNAYHATITRWLNDN